MRYEYIIHRDADGPGLGPPPEFSWRYGPWTKCTVTCGTGEEGGLSFWVGMPALASCSLLICGATVSLECCFSEPRFPHL